MLKEATIHFCLFDESYFSNICTLQYVISSQASEKKRNICDFMYVVELKIKQKFKITNYKNIPIIFSTDLFTNCRPSNVKISHHPYLLALQGSLFMDSWAHLFSYQKGSCSFWCVLFKKNKTDYKTEVVKQIKIEMFAGYQSACSESMTEFIKLKNSAKI